MNDRLTLLQKEGEAYEKHDDTPTVTFVASSECLTLPYHSLRWMRRDPSSGQVHLEIDAFRIILSGEDLHGLWRELQLFRVRGEALDEIGRHLDRRVDREIKPELLRLG